VNQGSLSAALNHYLQSDRKEMTFFLFGAAKSSAPSIIAVSPMVRGIFQAQTRHQLNQRQLTFPTLAMVSY